MRRATALWVRECAVRAREREYVSGVCECVSGVCECMSGVREYVSGVRVST